jgi:hypothetical protein
MCCCVAIERQIRHDLFQLRIFILKLLQPPHLWRLHALVFFLPIEIGQMSATGTPSAPCFRMNAFCASENFDAFIAFRSSQRGNSAWKQL